jgi:hypothetical protein
MDVDWVGVARVERSLGGEQNLLLLKSKRRYEADLLDEAVPVDDGEGLANGGWFSGPPGWMLFIEGLPEQMTPWIQQLADRLAAAGVEGTLTGARTVGPPSWASADELMFGPRLNCLLGYQPADGFWRLPGWGCGGDALEQAVSHGVDWMCAQGGRAQANIELRANFWVDPATAKQILIGQANSTNVSVSNSYQPERQEIRGVDILRPGAVSLTSRAGRTGWAETIGEFRAALLQAPVERLSIAMISHLTWGDWLMSPIPGTDYFDRFAYDRFPDRWHEFTLDPCGIQILTDQHLAKAGDLSGWTTTRLDEHHYLVEARDLAAWYAKPLLKTDPVDPDLLAQARADFGGMILTHAIAEELDMTHKPKRD